MTAIKTDTEAAIQADIKVTIGDLRAIQKRLVALTRRAQLLPSYKDGMAANDETDHEVYVETLGLRIDADLRWVAGVDDIEGRAIAEAIKRLQECVATTAEDCERQTRANVENYRHEIQEKAAMLAKRAEEFTAEFDKDIEDLCSWAKLLPGVRENERGVKDADRSVDWLQIFCAIDGVQENDLPMLKEMAEHLRDAAEAKADDAD